MPPFPVQPEGLVASDGKSGVGIQVCFLDAGHINIFIKSFSEQNLFVEDSLCIPLQNVERSYGLTMIGAFLASRIYPLFPKPGSSHRDGVTTSRFGWVLLRHRTRHSTSPAGLHWQNTITFRSEILHPCDVVALHFHCAPLAQCIWLRRWFSCPSFPLVADPPTKAEEHPLP